MNAVFRPLTLSVLRGRYGVLRFAPDASVPEWATRGDFFSVTHSQDELSVICGLENVSESDRAGKNWRVLKVHGPFSLDEIGVLASLVVPLAKEQVSVFAISTFDTDFLLVQTDHLHRAIAALREGGHRVLEID